MAAIVTILNLSSMVLFHIPAATMGYAAPPTARAVAMTLHNHGNNGWIIFTAWAWATNAQEGG